MTPWMVAKALFAAGLVLAIAFALAMTFVFVGFWALVALLPGID